MNSLLHVVPQVLQPSTNDHLVADGELSRSAATSSSTDPTAPRNTPLSRAQDARPYQQTYFLCRDLAATKAHLISLEGWQLLMRVRDYCGWRYNDILFHGTELQPPAWRAR